MFNYKRYIEQLQLDAKKEQRTILLLHISIVPIAMIMTMMGSWLYGVISILISIIVLNLFISNRYSIQLESRGQQRVDAFIEAFIIIKIFLNNQLNVYRSLEETTKYVKPLLREDMLRLLEDIDCDKTIDPFIRFARKFKPLVIEQLLVGLYQLDTEGGNVAQLEAFDYMFDQFRIQKSSDARRRYEDRLDSMNMYPLIGAGIITMNLLFGVIIIILGAISEL